MMIQIEKLLNSLCSKDGQCHTDKSYVPCVLYFVEHMIHTHQEERNQGEYRT